MTHRRTCVIAMLALLLCSCKHPVKTATPAQPHPQPEVSMNAEAANEHLLLYVNPVFPKEAPEALYFDVVTLDIHIDIDGHIAKATPINGAPELWQAAVAAVLQWRYRPVGSGNDRAGAHTQVEVSFHRSPIAEEKNPEVIGMLPEEVRQDLVHQDCLIPRYRDASQSSYTKGSFRAPGSEDYAVVCHQLSHKTEKVFVYSLSSGNWQGEVIQSSTWEDDKIQGLSVKTDPPDSTGLHHDHLEVDISASRYSDSIYYYDGSRWKGFSIGSE
jgi:Gram-negative bacterial TonB protein C-terminal